MATPLCSWVFVHPDCYTVLCQLALGLICVPQATQVEFTTGASGQDYYDISLVVGTCKPSIACQQPGWLTATQRP